MRSSWTLLAVLVLGSTSVMVRGGRNVGMDIDDVFSQNDLVLDGVLDAGSSSALRLGKRLYNGVTQLTACGSGYMPVDAVCCTAGWCPTGTNCSGTNCVGTCPNKCGTMCTDVRYDYQNCGACGLNCPRPTNGVRFCSNGQCGMACFTGYTLNGTTCVVGNGPLSAPASAMTDTSSMRMASSLGMMSMTMSMMSTTTALPLGSSTQTAVAAGGTNGVTGGLANNGLPFPAIIGIAAGSALGLGLLLFIPVWSAVKRNQKRKRDAELREVRESNFEKMSAEKKRPWPAPDSAMLSAAPLSSALPTAMAMFTPVGAAARRMSMESDGASDWGSEMNFPNRNASLALNGKKMGGPKSAATPSGRLGEPNLPPGFQPHWFFTKVAGAQNKMNHLSVQYNGPPFVVSTRHDPSAEDEIALSPGHMVDVRLVFKDGWATGTNLTTGNYGVLPLTSLRLDDSAPSGQLESARLDSRSIEVTSQVLSERRMMAPKGGQSNAPGRSGFNYGPLSGFGSKIAIPSPDVNVRGPPSNFFPR